MGSLRQTDDTSLTLAERTLVGRAESCHLRLDDRRVSGQHALIYYSDGAWWLRDLGSRNGTYVDGQVVEPTDPRPLKLGSRLRFHASASRTWLFAEDGPPRARASRSDGCGPDVVADAGLMLLPDAQDPQVQIHGGPHGRWVGEWVASGATFEPQDGEELVAGDVRWRLALPPLGPGTHLPETVNDRPSTRPGIPRLRLVVRVSRDRESFEVIAHLDRRTVALASRACHELLLLLAEARLADQAQTALRPAEHGWMYAEDLAREIGYDRSKVNVDVCRLRKQFASELGLSDAAELIERRPRTQQLRVAVGQLTVEPM